MRGFTFVEMIVVVALFTILSLAMTSAIVQFYQTNAYTVAQTTEVQSAARVLKLVVRDMREATYADNGAFPIVTATATRFTFYSDIDRDNSVELVDYRLVNTTLLKYVTNAIGAPPSYPVNAPNETHTIAEYVRNTAQALSTFRYFDSAGVEVNGIDVTRIASVQIQIVVNVDPNRSPGLFTLTSFAALRNLKNNL